MPKATITEAVRATATREVKEETGLSVELHGLLDVVDYIETDDDGRTRRHYTLIDYLGVAVDAGEPRAGDDARDARWFTLAETERLPMWDKTREIIALAFSRAAGTRGT